MINIKKYIKYAIYVVVLILIVVFSSTNAIAKYKSEKTGDDNARVAKFGDLNFYEYTIDGNKLVTGNTAEVETKNIIAGTDFEKNLSIEFTSSEINTYLFLEVETKNWTVTTNDETKTNKVSIQNEYDEDMIYWILNNKWTLLESNNGKFVFYYEVPANNNFTDTLINKIIVNPIDMDSAYLLENEGHNLSFKAYALSALSVTPLEAWQYATNK